MLKILPEWRPQGFLDKLGPCYGSVNNNKKKVAEKMGREDEIKGTVPLCEKLQEPEPPPPVLSKSQAQGTPASNWNIHAAGTRGWIPTETEIKGQFRGFRRLVEEWQEDIDEEEEGSTGEQENMIRVPGVDSRQENACMREYWVRYPNYQYTSTPVVRKKDKECAGDQRHP